MKDSTAPSQGQEEESVGEVLGEAEWADEDDLEGEFADSEDFEKEMAEGAFPSEKTEESTEETAQSDSSEEIAEEDAEEVAEEEVAEEDAEDTEVAEEESTEEETELADTEEESTEEEVADSKTATQSFGSVVNNIRYEATENKIYIDGDGSLSYESRRNQSNNQFIIEIAGATLSESLQERPFVMKDFNTEMTFLQADQKDSNTVRIVVQMRENAGMPSVKSAENGSLVITPGEGGDEEDSMFADELSEGATSTDTASTDGDEVLPAKSLREFFLHTPTFTGKPISIHFKDVDVKEVLYFISEGTGLNMVIADDVQGAISIKLRNVPWDQALVTVMKTKKLGYLREGNVIRIMSLASLRTNQEEMQKLMKTRKVLAPTKVQVIPLTYTKVEDMKSQLSSLLTKDKDRQGSIVVDKHTNSLIITDTARVLEKVEEVIKGLDTAPRQVMIEAKVIEARERFVRNLGIGWNFEGAELQRTSNPFGLGVDGNLVGLGGSGSVTEGSTISSTLSVGTELVGDLDIALGLAETEELIHVVSSPRIMVLNGESAKITQQTEDIDLVTTQTAENSQTQPQRIKASLELSVSPQITALGSIFMDIKLTRQFFGARTVAAARPLNSRDAETKVLVNNGQTIVIGGIYQQDETKAENGIPLLKHIPIIKWLFSNMTGDTQRNELLLFITPRILEFNRPNQTAGLN